MRQGSTRWKEQWVNDVAQPGSWAARSNTAPDFSAASRQDARTFAIGGPDETWKENSESGRLRRALATGCPQTSAA